MTEVVKADTESIIEALTKQSLDIDTFYNHVFDGTIKHYYHSVLAEVVSDLLTLPIEREYAGLEPLEEKELIDVLTNTIVKASVIIAEWFFKDQKTVEHDLSNELTKSPAEDIRESRFLRRHQLLN